ncbi:hypothetical protein BP6252_09930 [Coleophoma cylindrospora]|uniref:Enoyl reductase (ER) domain-containing protein n=1 Tax=Coleophoma cylindrospora TaxID=1849047 RepID=A0A3D8QX08_9HELO|nr:hypothetical protein BP6252_09930 [Coleophoma cylindrospora]
MKEAIVASGPKVTLHDVPIPTPKAGEVLIKVIVSGSNPKDWKVAELIPPHNSGDDIAGIVESVGENVYEFKRGDRVAAFHQMTKPHGSFAEYGIALDCNTFHIPEKVSFEEAATIPLAAMTAAVGLYNRLGLPEPWKPTTTPIPLVVYGGASAVGAFAIKLAQVSNIHPIIAVAGNGQTFVETLISREKGDTIVDYRKGDQAVIAGIKEALQKAGASELRYAFDAVSEHNSFQNLSEVLAAEGSKITLVLPGKDYSAIPKHIEHTTTSVGMVQDIGNYDPALAVEGSPTGGKDFGAAYFRLLSRGLNLGWLAPHPHTVVPGGLNGVEEALANLKAGKASATKYVFRVEETK